MSTTTLTLYKNTKLDDLKNFVIDDIETYLSGKSNKVISNFQYQRFVLNLAVKIDNSQSYFLKGASLNRWDYAKISIVDDNTTYNYYYFILKASWKAQSTIELQLKMDTLNTYKFSNTEADDSYVLSKKTLVTREHKDRLTFKETKTEYVPVNPTQDEQDNISDWKNETWFSGSFTIKFDCNALHRAISEASPVLTYPLVLYPHDQDVWVYTIDNGEPSLIIAYKVEFYSSYFRVYTDAFNYIDIKYNTDETILFNVLSLSMSGTPTEFDVAATWSYIKDYFLEDKVYNAQSVKYYERNIDQFQEGLSTTLFKNKEEQLLDKDGINQWYVMYASTYAVTQSADDTAAKYVNPVAVRFYSDRGYTLSTTSAKIVTFYAKELVDYGNYAEYILLNRETLGSGYFEYNGVQRRASDLPANAVGFSIRRDSKNLFTHLGVYSYNDAGLRYEWNSLIDNHSVSFIRFYDINEVPVYKASGSLFTTMYYRDTTIYIGSGSGASTGTCDEWDKVDLTSSLLIKAFAFPYSPVEFLVGKTSFDALPSNTTWSSDGQCIELIAPQEEAFDRNIKFEQQSPFNDCFVRDVVGASDIGSGKARKIKFESKLLHSDYHQPKFVYDSFAFSFNLEDVDVANIPLKEYFTAQYVVSKNVVSKFAFIFNQYVCKREVQHYNNVLTIERNNEKALFNNAYINYIRSGGYSYDQKKANSQNAVNGITTAFSILGGTASLVAGWGTGNTSLMVGGVALLSSTAMMIARNIHTAQEQDRSISQKLQQQYMQGTSVQGSEDIDILTAFSGNKAKLCYYELSTIMKNAMWDLFHYCGYATHEQKVPNVNTRLYFNYVQAEIVFEEFSFDEDIADDIRNKWKQGVTFFHKVSGSYDIDQEYENFEVSLL